MVDDNVFVSGYDITVTGNTSQNRLPVVQRLRKDWGFTINESVAFLDSLPKTIYELHPKDDSLEIRRKYMEVGLTVELKWRSGYITYYEYSQYNEHQRYQLTNTPQEPDF